jgi:AcrR family transcriptional regulator
MIVLDMGRRILTVWSVRIPSSSSMGQDATSVTASTTPQTDRVVAILEAACRVIVREGAHGLRMASVADEAGVSKALVHYYFSTRRELLRSAFAFSESRLDELVDEEIAGLVSGAARLERVLLVSIDADTPISEQRALWNEVWSSLRFDDELKPLVEGWYRTWLDRVVRLLEEGRADGSVPDAVEAPAAGARLAAAADGVDSMLYLGILGRDAARDVLLGSLHRELATP